MEVKNKLVKAFTLAEVLITLGIIGIVAEMTIPDLVHDFQEKILVSQLKETYSILNQAYSKVLNDNGDPTAWNVTSLTDINNYFKPYFQSAPISYTYGAKELRKSNVWNFSPTIKLPNGVVMQFNHPSSVAGGLTCASYNNECFLIEADINGVRSPNRHGVDIFTFEVRKNAIIIRGAKGSFGAATNGDLCNPSADTGSPGWWNGSACGAWVLLRENMDYLKCIDGGDGNYCHVYKY